MRIMKVAVVRNRSREGVLCRFGQVCPEEYGRRSVQMTIDALRTGGHTVAVLEGDKNLLAALEAFLPADAATNRPGGMVFNMAYGIQGQARYTHVPAMLEMAGIPYSGAGPLGHAVSLDKVVTKILMQAAGVPTPHFKVMNETEMDDAGLAYPLIVKPRHESTSFGLAVVERREELRDAVLAVVAQYQQDALVEEYIEGREVAVGLLGNRPVEILPLVEFDFGDRPMKAVTWNDKYHKAPDEAARVCPAPVGDELAERLRAMALATFRACHCQDYSRVDIRIDPSGNPFALEINSMASLGPGGAFVLAARTAGYSFQALVCRILDAAHERYFGVPAPPDRMVAHALPDATTQSDSFTNGSRT
jgi:D-alanine-D-alanine ligase